MAASTEYSDEGLSLVFDKALALHDQVEDSTEPSTSEDFQHKVKKCIMMLEDCTRIVSLINIFSSNENYKEVVTEHLKYFMLPVLLGDMNSRLTGTERAEVVEASQIYYIDFLQRVQDYEFVNEFKIPELKSVKVEDGGSGPPPGRPDLAQMNKERDAKMARFREKKELEGEILNLKALINPGTRDEDLERKLYVNMIKRFVHIARDELESLQMEVDVLKYMAMAKSGQIKEEPPKKSRPFQPMIITKDKIQKEVYGLGYPSIPVLSVDEFYEQRVREGWWKPPSSSQTALQDNARNPELIAQQEEEATRELEEKDDRDDEDELARARAKDDWKDDHRRGEGNRHNMG